MHDNVSIIELIMDGCKKSIVKSPEMIIKGWAFLNERFLIYQKLDKRNRETYGKKEKIFDFIKIAELSSFSKFYKNKDYSFFINILFTIKQSKEFIVSELFPK